MTVCSVAVITRPQLVLAANPALDKLEKIGAKDGPYQGASEYTLAEVAGVVIEGLLALLGVIFLALMLYAGYHWMTARGDEEKVTKAKDTIRRAIIGLIVVVGAYAIWAFIFGRLF